MVRACSHGHLASLRLLQLVRAHCVGPVGARAGTTSLCVRGNSGGCAGDAASCVSLPWRHSAQNRLFILTSSVFCSVFPCSSVFVRSPFVSGSLSPAPRYHYMVYTYPRGSWGFQWKTRPLHWTPWRWLGVPKPGCLKAPNQSGASGICIYIYIYGTPPHGPWVGAFDLYAPVCYASFCFLDLCQNWCVCVYIYIYYRTLGHGSLGFSIKWVPFPPKPDGLTGTFPLRTKTWLGSSTPSTASWAWNPTRSGGSDASWRRPKTWTRRRNFRRVFVPSFCFCGFSFFSCCFCFSIFPWRVSCSDGPVIPFTWFCSADQGLASLKSC